MRKLVHDARDSLNSIALNSDVLVRVLDEKGGGADGRARRAAASIRDAAYRLADQMAALFERRDDFDPVAVLRQFARECREEAGNPEVELVGLPEEGPAVQGGEGALRRFLGDARRRAAARSASVRLGMSVGEEAVIVHLLGREEGREASALWLPVQGEI